MAQHCTLVHFTPPAAPLTAVTNTNFLVKGINASIIDKSQTSPSMYLWGDTKSSTAQYKFLTSSMYFDGSNDYIQRSRHSKFWK